MIPNRLRRRCLLGLLAVLLGNAGCQMLASPFSASRGLPAQWEPEVQSSSP